MRKRRKDAYRYRFFLNQGYDLFVIWEHEFVKEPGRVKELLKALHKAAIAKPDRTAKWVRKSQQTLARQEAKLRRVKRGPVGTTG